MRGTRMVGREDHPSEEDKKDVKRVREYFKLPIQKKDPIERECLRCGKTFIAEHKFNRTCCNATVR